MLKPPFCRQGNKTPILKDILEIVPQHEIYCEPFAGSAVVFFNLPKAKLSILNDLDNNVYSGLKLLQKAPLDINKYEVDLSTSDKLKYFYDHHSNSVNDLLLYHKIISCTGFNAKPVKNSTQIYLSRYHPTYFIEHLEQYKKMLAGVKITNKNYIDVVLKYDSPDTFFFIDPPYENTDRTFYPDIGMNYDELSFILQNLKGKFLLTINDSPNIRKIFSQFKIKKINVSHTWMKIDKSKIRKELFIMNY